MDVRVFTADVFGENAYLVRPRESPTVLAIDPGGKAAAMVEVVAAEELVLEAVLLTHAHLDHIEGVSTLVRRTGAPIYLHPDDRPLYQAVGQQATMFGLDVETPPPADFRLEHGQVLRLGGCTLEVLHAPGHSPGHVIFYAADAGIAFVGDVVFLGSIGRTDLPGGDFRQLIHSIRERVLTLPDETVLYPGHGDRTTVGHERVSNPFLVPQYGGGLA